MVFKRLNFIAVMRWYTKTTPLHGAMAVVVAVVEVVYCNKSAMAHAVHTQSCSAHTTRVWVCIVESLGYTDHAHIQVNVGGLP